MMDSADITNRFMFHPANAKKGLQHDNVRRACLQMAQTFNESLPDGREKNNAIDRLDEVMFWANAAIARQSNGDSGN